MVTLQSNKTAKDAAEALLRELRGCVEVEALCLFGSVARGMPEERSDVDALVVASDRTSAKRLKAKLRAGAAVDLDGSTQLRLMTRARLEKEFSERTVFAAHLAREGRILIDRSGALVRLFAAHPKDAPVRESAAGLSSQLQAYDDLDWCGGYYLFCLADMYAWGRSGAMLALARQGEFEFDRDKVFDRLAAARPDLQEATKTIRRLRPFWETVNRTAVAELPFPAVGSHVQAAEARDACQAILTQSL